jgi:glycosyltransferase involved in cell wall biosynthesis
MLFDRMKIALVHDWITGMRGGEKVLEVFCELFPDAHLYTLLHNKGSASDTIENMDIRTSFIQHLPLAEKKYRYFLPLFPTAIERFDFRGYDVVLSSSHCVAKGVITGYDTINVCYCFTPMRYIWDMYDQYFTEERSGAITRRAASLVRNYLRKWDVESSRRVNRFVAISKYVAGRIRKYYDREPDIIFPPVDCSYFNPSSSSEDFYLIVSPRAPNKRVDIGINAFNKLGLPLKIIGSGQEEDRLRRIANRNIEFMGWQSDETVRDHYAACKALIFPGIDDFGIVPLEAQASGKPVIAYGGGGALETIIPIDNDRLKMKSENGQSENATGIFFYEQTPESLAQAVLHFEDIKDSFNKQEIRKNAKFFDRAIFKEKIKNYIEQEYKKFRQDSQDK